MRANSDLLIPKRRWAGIVEIGWPQNGTAGLGIVVKPGGVVSALRPMAQSGRVSVRMPQVQLPLFPEGTTLINSELGYAREGQQVVYLNGHLPVFTHEVEDLASFRLITTQLIVNGTASQSEIVKTFGVPLRTVKRYCEMYRRQGPAGFYKPAARRRGHRLTPERLAEVQGMLDEGQTPPEISRKTGLLSNTLHKAIDQGRLKQVKKTEARSSAHERTGTTQSERGVADQQAPLGVATTRFDERLFASLGQLEAAPIRFEAVTDVPNGGVLCALPALLAFGLLEHTGKKFSLPAGYYPLAAIFLLIAFLALARVKSIEAVRYEPPGEWGKLIGLDRIPEVRTLRQKIDVLCRDGQRVREWSGILAQEWMKADPEAAGCLYVDGHVRVYHGSLTPLPKRYVSRQRLCLRGTTDYWVNAMDGQPFFVVTQAVDPGLRKVLEEQIVPRLLQEVPGQPTQEQLDADRLLARFTIIFDREGYSPELFARLWLQRVAVITYRKFTGEEDYWPAGEFQARTVKLVNGEEVQLWLAERGVPLSNGLWVREIRRRDEKTGHQTAILTTNFRRALEAVAAAMFARWCQENFFRYMGEHYNLNRMIENGTEPVPDTTLVPNPALKAKTQEVRRQRAQLLKEQAQFEALTAPAQPEALAQFELEKGQWLERIQQRQQTINLLRAERKALPKRIAFKDLPEKDRFAQLRTPKKHFIDTIKLIAYRAETALVHIAREKLERSDDARSLIRQVLTSTVDLCPDLANQVLKVRLHPLATAAHNEVLRHLCTELTDTETEYPGTQLRMIFEPIGANEVP